MQVVAAHIKNVKPEDVIILSIGGQINVCKIVRNNVEQKTLIMKLCSFDSNHENITWSKEFSISVAGVTQVVKFVDEADVSKLEVESYNKTPWFNAKVTDEPIISTTKQPITETTKHNVKPN